MDKYQFALIEYARTKRALKECNASIAHALENSYKAAEATWPKDRSGWPVIPDEWRQAGDKNLWLLLAYEREHSVYEGDFYVNHDDDLEGFLAQKCQEALMAHKMIKIRKKLRKDHGIAKRRLTVLGNKLLKNT